MTKPKPLVSVVITCYNYGQFLSEAIESVLSQSYKNIEIIVVDDGSTDNTKEAAGAYKGHKNFHYLYQENQGVASARNIGLNNAKGTYLVFLDADDILKPEFVKVHLECLEQNTSIDYAYCLMKVFGRKEEAVAEILEFDPKLLVQRNFIHSSAMFRCNVIKKYRYDQKLQALEDWDLYLGLLENNHIGKLIPRELLLYRKHDALVSRSDSILNAESQVGINYSIYKKHPALYPKGYATTYLLNRRARQIWQLVKSKVKGYAKKK